MTDPRLTLRRLVDSVERLGSEPAQQIEYLVQLGVADSADELALEFDDAYRPLLPHLDELGVSASAQAVLQELDATLTLMSGQGAPGWAFSALEQDAAWAQVRRLARRFHVSSMRVVVDVDSLEEQPSSAVTGRIWLSVGGYDFPENGWSDFPVVILAWWLSALDSLESMPGECTELLFMDGPFEVQIRSALENLSDLDLFGDGIEFTSPFQVDAAVLREQIREAAVLVSEGCRARGWESDALAELRRAIAS